MASERNAAHKLWRYLEKDKVCCVEHAVKAAFSAGAKWQRDLEVEMTEHYAAELKAKRARTEEDRKL